MDKQERRTKGRRSDKVRRKGSPLGFKGLEKRTGDERRSDQDRRG